MIFNLISIALFIGYAALITAISIGWWRLKKFNEIQPSTNVKISIIVAVRNEAGNIGALLNCLLQQDYPADLYEIIIVDDQSTDETILLVQEIISLQKGIHNLKLVTLDMNDNSGKKAALENGIHISSGELIVITDADCTAGSKWISTIASFNRAYKPQMILGPVQMTGGASFFGKLQALEFISLISSAAGSCNAGFPLLANGANMAFTRQAYETCGGFTGNMQYPSGDDMFLMMSIKKKFGAEAIRFLRSQEAIVSTPAIQEWRPFIQQRIRWVSKSRGYTDPIQIGASLSVFLVNAWLVVTALMAAIFPEFLTLFLLFYFGKLIIDLPLMLGFNHFQRSKALLWLFPIMELLNAVYTLFIGIAGNLGKYEWKGRRVSTNSHKLPANFHK
jgi:cellulose synthase/poly-beta-1,6-N-acetylglucosamine synthase-like glycosyltransferase